MIGQPVDPRGQCRDGPGLVGVVVQALMGADQQVEAVVLAAVAVYVGEERIGGEADYRRLDATRLATGPLVSPNR